MQVFPKGAITGVAKQISSHAQLYTAAKGELDDEKQGAREFYVCTVTGGTFDQTPAESSCPAVPGKESYKKVV